jgi:hypothetical protein
VSSYEIQHVIQELIRGNANFIWGVLSPVVLTETNRLVVSWLRHTVNQTAAKNIAPSIRGIATACLVDIWRGKKCASDPLQIAKKYKQAIRTLRFGTQWLRGRGAVFCSVSDEEANPAYYAVALNNFDRALEVSKLPERVDPVPFRNLLLFLRLRDLGPEDLL